MSDISNSSPINAISILTKAIRSQTSDIHLDPGFNEIIVRFRKAGRLYITEKLKLDRGLDIIKEFKKMAKLPLRQTRAPQNGHFESSSSDHHFIIEVATLPVVSGEKLTLHVHQELNDHAELMRLGLWGSTLKVVQQALAQPQGVILVTGNQWSYIRITISELATELQSKQVPVVLIDESPLPLHRIFKSVRLLPESGLNMGRRITLLNRQGTPVIAVVTLKDRQTAQAAVQAADKGSLLLMGVPGGNAVDGLVYLRRASRLIKTMIVTKLSISQLYVRGLCSTCRQVQTLSFSEKQRLMKLFGLDVPTFMKKIHELEKTAKASGLEPKLPLLSSETHLSQLWRASDSGCENCDFTGYNREVGVFEACYLSPALQSAIMSGDNPKDLRKIMSEQGDISMQIDALIKALRGYIDLNTLLKIST